MTFRTASKHLVTFFLLFLLVFPPHVMAGFASLASGSKETEIQIQKLERYYQHLAQLRRYADRSQFDLSEVLRNSDYEANKIIEFVTTQVRFEPYPGLLRGAQGTLMSKAGNSLDQSLLLATLLRDAGYDARIVKSHISESLSTNLINTLTLETIAPAEIGNEGKIRNVMEDILVDVAGSSSHDAVTKVAEIFSAPTQTGLPGFVKENAQFVIDNVSSRFDENSRSIQNIIKEAQEYFWVEWRENPSADWLGSHPAFGSKLPEDFMVLPISYYTDHIPDDQYFMFRVELVLEQRIGTEIKKTTLASTPDRPAANLVGVPITITLVPNSIASLADLANLDDSLNKASLWIPFINGSPGTYAFDYLGNAVHSIAAGAPGAALFQAVGEGFASAAGALSDRSSRDPIASIEHLWAEYIVTHPVTGEKRHRTDLLAESLAKRPGSSADQELIRKGLLSSSHTVMLAVGRYPSSYVFDRSLERASEVVRFAISEIDEGAENWAENLSQLNMDFMGHMDFFEVVDSALISENILSYRPAPSVLVFSQAMYPPDQAIAILNIVDNPRRSIERRDGVLALSPENNILAGVWESTLEGLMLGAANRWTFSAANELNRSSNKNEQFLVLSPEEGIAAFPLLHSSFAGEWVGDDLNNERLVLIPSAEVGAPNSSTSWWRIDLNSGETLAVMGGGYGVVVTEDLKFKILLGVSYIAYVAGFWGCMGGDNPDARTPKVLSCQLCGMFAFVSSYLTVSAVLTSLPAIITAWRGGKAVTITIETTVGAQIKQKAWEVAGLLMGVFCGVAGVAD
jgi:hypothetical protein